MSSDSEDELLMAAGQWATDQNENGEEEETLADNDKAETTSNWDYVKKNKKDKKAPKRDVHAQTNTNSKTATAPKSFSLHLTKVPFDATQSTIRCAFIEKNCRIASVRLVYDTDQKSRERKFRGVAFVDLEDEASYSIGLKQHNTAFLGGKRRVNVRPTKTRNELSEIVKKTEERVAALIARSKEKKRSREEEEGEKDGDGGAAKQKKRKHNKNTKKGTSTGEGKSDQTKSNHDNSKNQSKIRDSSPRKSDEAAKPKRRKSKDKNDNKSDESPKLTEKQRAQKAAIIRSKKKR